MLVVGCFGNKEFKKKFFDKVAQHPSVLFKTRKFMVNVKSIASVYWTVYFFHSKLSLLSFRNQKELEISFLQRTLEVDFLSSLCDRWPQLQLSKGIGLAANEIRPIPLMKRYLFHILVRFNVRTAKKAQQQFFWRSSGFDGSRMVF